jgi:hypothetical protein
MKEYVYLVFPGYLPLMLSQFEFKPPVIRPFTATQSFRYRVPISSFRRPLCLTNLAVPDVFVAVKAYRQRPLRPGKPFGPLDVPLFNYCTSFF